jgi:L-methionine (R)-S-oxide reductase
MENVLIDLQQLRVKFSGFDWVGIYIMNHNENILELGPFIGAPTEHTRIPFGKGICGQVALSGETFHSPNVNEEDNYIACSIETQSELVVPIYDKENILVAQLDVDSHSKHTFTPEVIQYCEDLCKKWGDSWSENKLFNHYKPNT